MANSRTIAILSILALALALAAACVSSPLLAPDDGEDGPGYTLFLECRRDPPADLADRLEVGLRRNYHYRWCVKLGQLAPARVYRVRRGAYETYLEACRRNGRRIGEIKPVALSPEPGWRRRFEEADAGEGARSRKPA